MKVALVVWLVEGGVCTSVVKQKDTGVGASELCSLLAQYSIAYTYVAGILGELACESGLDMPDIILLAQVG